MKGLVPNTFCRLLLRYGPLAFLLGVFAVQPSSILLAETLPAETLAVRPQDSRFALRERVKLDVVDDLNSPFYSLSELRRVRAAAATYYDEIESELARVFHYKPQRRVTLRILSEAQYRARVGGASWTNAMYYDGQITIPLRGSNARYLRRMRRSLRHEFVHAACAELSREQTPAWLEEGLAQLLEGPINPILAPALRQLVNEEGLLELPAMNQGFAMLEDRYVAAAYAQSLFAVRTLVNRKGFSAIRQYLKALHRGSNSRGSSSDAAFETAFGVSLLEFENELRAQARLWADSESPQL